MVATYYFDAIQNVRDYTLFVNPFDLLAITTLTNGDTNTIASTNYVFEPRNNTPRYAITLKTSSGKSWQYNSDPENAISILGIWGCHDDYSNAWTSLTTISESGGLDTSETDITLAGGAGNPGELWKIDSEYFYLSSRATVTATVVRGVNGSTAATHDNGATIYRWDAMSEVRNLCRAATIEAYRLRESPQAESAIVGDHTITLSKDVVEYIGESVWRLGLKR
jgi:hypothetical protein